MNTKTIKESNPWWENKHWQETDIHLERIRTQKIKWEYHIIKDTAPGIYSLRGPRQVGKTSWIKQKIKELTKKENPKNILFYSCDNINKKELEEIIDLFLEQSEPGKKYLFLDEIPFVEGWEYTIKHLYDAGKLKNCFVLLSGSNSIDIKKSTERLPGRGDEGKRHYTMHPLTYEEYLQAIKHKIPVKEAEAKINLHELQKKFDEYTLTGGFLKTINEYHETGRINDATYDVYLKWIIGDLAKLNLKEKYAKQLLRRITETYTTEVSWTRLKTGTEIDTHNTTAKYADALEEMFIIQTIYKLDYNKKAPAYPKSKKIYYTDPFIMAATQKWINSTEQHFEKQKEYTQQNKSKICEGIILNELTKELTKRTTSNIFNYNNLIFYWTNKQKTKEIDFTYKNTAIELKYQNTIKKSDYKPLKEFKNSYLITKNHFAEKTYPIEAFLILHKKQALQ